VTNWSVFHLSALLRSRGWQVPAYTLPANQEHRSVLRIVVRAGFSRDMADQLLADVERNLAWLATAQQPLPPAADEPGFRH
jgi:glutamate decarboxylase